MVYEIIRAIQITIIKVPIAIRIQPARDSTVNFSCGTTNTSTRVITTLSLSIGTTFEASSICNAFNKGPAPSFNAARVSEAGFFVRFYQNNAGILAYFKELWCKMTENMQARRTQSHQAFFVRCCLYYYYIRKAPI